jgi:superfamily II DNA or RNA helicase
MELRDYQIDIVSEATSILKRLNIVYLAMEVRTGKTLTALSISSEMKANKVLFVTKKKAISSIESDYKMLNPSYSLVVVNYESVHKLEDTDFDIVIVDEAHGLGAYPKPSLRTKRLKEIIGNKKLIMLSGTPTPESYSQFYHQFWISGNTPFIEKSFYKWAHNYVNITKKKINGYDVNNYSNANEKLIRQNLSKYIISFTQKQAGFNSKVNENVLEVEMLKSTYILADTLKKHNVYEGKKGGVILADTGVKLMQKLHQIYSGTVKLEDGTRAIIDYSKGNFIKEYFKGHKIGIFYKYKAEFQLLKEVFGESLTNDLTEFNATNKSIALQIVAGREGVKLSKAKALVFFNIDHSATSYFQAKDRMTTIDRLVNNVFWVFSKRGIETNIYKAVQDKKDYTLNHFRRDERKNISV